MRTRFWTRGERQRETEDGDTRGREGRHMRAHLSECEDAGGGLSIEAFLNLLRVHPLFSNVDIAKENVILVLEFQ